MQFNSSFTRTWHATAAYASKDKTSGIALIYILIRDYKSSLFQSDDDSFVSCKTSEINSCFQKNMLSLAVEA